MYYYQINNQYCFALDAYDYQEISKETFEKSEGYIYFLNKMPLGESKDRLLITDTKELSIQKEKIEQINLDTINEIIEVSGFIQKKITEQKAIMINPSYGLNFIEGSLRKKSVTVLGLGDVGGTLLLGLRLLGKDVIDTIRLYDPNENKIQRYILEMNQIAYPNHDELPKVTSATMEDLFETDVFIFTASKFVPKVGNEGKDVRMIQYEANKEIIKEYAKLARDREYKGLFAVVSDPVDLLCKVVFDESNKNEKNVLDYKGLLPNQVRGFGLGVMNGRAGYYADMRGVNYKAEGRVYGPHGKGLIVADSLENYSEKASIRLTEDVITANLKVREVGFKPYIAPALSSGALSIIETLRENYNYATVFINGHYWGIKNKFVNGCVGIERRKMPSPLIERIKNSYDELRRQYEEN